MLLVATCAAALWSTRVVLDSVTPVRKWARDVRYSATEQRREAARRLGSLTAEEIKTAVPALLDAIGDEDEQVAVTAVQSLGSAGQAALRGRDTGSTQVAIEALTAALKDGRAAVRTAAAKGMRTVVEGDTLETEAAGALTTALSGAMNDPSDAVRSMSAAALGSIGAHYTIDPPQALVEALDGDTSHGVRRASAQSLGRFRKGRDRVTLALLRALSVDEPGTRAACDSALDALRFDKGKPRSAAIVPALIEALGSRERRARYHAAAILGEIGPEAAVGIPSLIRMLQEPVNSDRDGLRSDPASWDPSGQAALALGRVAPGTRRAHEVIGALTEVIRAPGLGRRRAMAAEALAEFDRKQLEPAVPVLLAVLTETVGIAGPPAPSVCMALGRAAPGTPQAGEAVSALTAVLDSDWEYTRRNAAKALAGFGRQAGGALPRLRVAAVEGGRPFVRDAAAAAVAAIEAADGAPSVRGEPINASRTTSGRTDRP
ncbi:MAG: HEAT repeat domain-containing protein [Isosphaeraceae bacterium]|nr:HEAT repeat domain-containing protein [Isosphaeraceae bacterium]